MPKYIVTWQVEELIDARSVLAGMRKADKMHPGMRRVCFRKFDWHDERDEQLRAQRKLRDEGNEE